MILKRAGIQLVVLLLCTIANSVIAGKAKDLIWSDAQFADGTRLCTQWLQTGIDSVHRSGGGKLKLTKGLYLTGGLTLKSGVEIVLQDATLLGSTNPDDYQDHIPAYPNNMNKQSYKFIVWAEGHHDIGISGNGTIDGQGAHPNFKYINDLQTNRPFIIRFVDCKNVTVKGITLKDGANWIQQYQHCANVLIDGIKVYSFTNRNNDGIDIDACKGVTIQNSTIQADDDGICLKSSSRDKCERVLVRNCTVGSNCNPLKLGTASIGGFQNIRFENIKIVKPAEESHIWKRQYGLAGIALEIVDGGRLNNVTVNQVEVTDVMTPIFLRLGDRGKVIEGDPKPHVGTFEQVTISNLTATRLLRKVSSCVMGIPGHYIKDVTLKDIRIIGPGGAEATDAKDSIPEVVNKYPENKMFGPWLAGSVLYARHAKNLKLINCQFSVEKPDVRPLVALDDVQRVKVLGPKSTISKQQVVAQPNCTGIEVK